MRTCPKSMFKAGISVSRRTREVVDDGRCDLRADDRVQLLSRRAPHASQTAERRQQRPTTTGTDAGHGVELRTEIAHGAGAPMERDGEPMRLVADALDQQ